MADIDFVFERAGNKARGIARPAIQTPVDYHICLTTRRRSADCLSQLREMIGLMLAGCTPAGGTRPRSDPGPFASSEAVNQSTPGTARQTRAQPIQRKHLLKCGQGRSSAWCPRIGQQQVSTRQVLWPKTLTNCRLSVERHHTFRCVQTSYLSVLGAIMFDEEIARLRAHGRNIGRYRRLLETDLSEIERQFVERRLTEEKSAVEVLTAVRRRTS